MTNILTTEILHKAIQEGKFIFITQDIFQGREVDERAKREREMLEYRNNQKKMIELIKREAENGIIHTMTSFAIKFQHQHNLGKKREISDFLSDMGRNRLINFFNNPEDYGIVCHRKYKEKTMFMCTVGMKVTVGKKTQIRVMPKHFKSLVDGSMHELWKL